MYGEPLKPSECLFKIFIDDDNEENEMFLEGEGRIALVLSDDTDYSNDNIREVDHPDFEKFWDNVCESTFLASDEAPFKTKADAIAWCLSLDMIPEDEED